MTPISIRSREGRPHEGQPRSLARGAAAYSRSLLLPGTHAAPSPTSASPCSAMPWAPACATPSITSASPCPRPQPVKIIRLRPYLDAKALRTLLLPAPGGPDVVGRSAGARRDRRPAGGGRAPPPRCRSIASASSRSGCRRIARSCAAASRPRRSGASSATASPGCWRGPTTPCSPISSRPSTGGQLRARGEEVPPALSKGAWTLRTRGPGRIRSPALRRPRSPRSLLGGGAGSRGCRPAWRWSLIRCRGTTATAAASASPGWSASRNSRRSTAPWPAPPPSAGMSPIPTDAFFLPLDTRRGSRRRLEARLGRRRRPRQPPGVRTACARPPSRWI